MGPGPWTEGARVADLYRMGQDSVLYKGGSCTLRTLPTWTELRTDMTEIIAFRHFIGGRYLKNNISVTDS